MNCDKCQHSGICMYEEGARRYEGRVKEAAEADKPAFIEFRISCQKFKFKYADKKKSVQEVNA